jgi:hemerythrin-like domain-containing protein
LPELAGGRRGPAVTLSPEELGIAEASLRFALENCPVDGGILTEDGRTSSEESVEVLLKKLEAAKARPGRLDDLTEEEIKLLEALAEYAVQECPIDGTPLPESDRGLTKADIRALREKYRGLSQKGAKISASSAIETLEEEHRLISRVVKILPAIRRNVDAGAVDERVLSDVVDFFSAFTDRCHHAKEEDLLFPALLQRGVSPKGCPVGHLMLEHQQGRGLMAALSLAIEKYKEGDSDAAGSISSILGDASELYAGHIWREEYLLFPMSEKVLPNPDREKLAGSFAAVQAKFGSGFTERYESVVKRLERSIGRASLTPLPQGPLWSAPERAW